MSLWNLGLNLETRVNFSTKILLIKNTNILQLNDSPSKIMEMLINKYTTMPEESKMLLFTRLRLAYNFARHETRFVILTQQRFD